MLGKGTVSPLHSSLPRSLSVCQGLCDLTRGLPGLHSPFEKGECELWLSGCLTEALRPGRSGPTFSLFCPTLNLFVPRKHEETAATNSR